MRRRDSRRSAHTRARAAHGDALRPDRRRSPIPRAPSLLHRTAASASRSPRDASVHPPRLRRQGHRTPTLQGATVQDLLRASPEQGHRQFGCSRPARSSGVRLDVPTPTRPRRADSGCAREQGIGRTRRQDSEPRRQVRRRGRWQQHAARFLDLFRG